MDGRKIVRQQIVAGQHVEIGAVCGRDLACDRFKFVRTHVLGRSVDEVADAEAGGDLRGDIVIDLHRQPRWRARRAAIAGEAIAAQSPAQLQRGGRVGVERVGEAPVANRQRVRRMGVGEGIVDVADAQHCAGQAVAAGQQRDGAGGGGEALRVQPRLQRRGLLCGPRGQTACGHRMQRKGVIGGGDEAGQCGHIRIPSEVIAIAADARVAGMRSMRSASAAMSGTVRSGTGSACGQRG